MTTYNRKNAWNSNGSFTNSDLLWYAKAVGVMQTRKLDDPTSWWFYAAIHGQLIINQPPGYPNWANIPLPPHVPTTPLPSKALIDQYWDQCQHGTWFFPPWHRGYLYALENILREIIIGLHGPGDWALPYWNYFGPGTEYKIPPAFTQPKLPDGSPNPLLVNARYGPNNNGVIYIPLAQRGITQDCQNAKAFTGVQPKYYGGANTGFAHSNGGFGALENNPHNPVHVAIGGQNPAGAGGLMSLPPAAALDPIFYLHHCNIDRLWAAWNAAGKSNPTDPNWHNGPTATGDRKFYMPKPDKSAWHYTPDMVDEISKLHYTYDNLSLGIQLINLSPLATRLKNLGLPHNQINNIPDMAQNINSELIGASEGPVKIDASGANTTVKLDDKGWNKVKDNLNKITALDLKANPTPSLIPDEVYLQIEGIKGKEDSVVCSVSINHQYVGHLSLFGLKRASGLDGGHVGNGLTMRFDITNIVDRLHLNNATDLNSLDVLIQPVNLVAEGNELSIDRVSIYREGE